MLRQFPLFDCHLHIIDPRFPLVANQGYLPEFFTCDDYLARTAAYDVRGGAIVSGSFQAFDQSYLMAALARMGPKFVGVTQLPMSVSDQEIVDLDAAGVRALRFNLKRGGSEELQHLSTMAHRVHALVDWHVELYVDAKELHELAENLLRLPAVSIDHLGLSAQSLPLLLRLVERGVRVKATGFGRVDFDVVHALKCLYAANPEALMFGTDLPSTRAPRAYLDQDFVTVLDAFGESAARAILHDNAINWYRQIPKSGEYV